MNDLVQRLRKSFDGGDYSILTEAATEIELLLAALKRLIEDIDAGFPRDEGYDTATELLNQQQPSVPK